MRAILVNIDWWSDWLQSSVGIFRPQNPFSLFSKKAGGILKITIIACGHYRILVPAWENKMVPRAKPQSADTFVSWKCSYIIKLGQKINTSNDKLTYEIYWEKGELVPVHVTSSHWILNLSGDF